LWAKVPEVISRNDDLASENGLLAASKSWLEKTYKKKFLGV